jgi:hypothetical protein
MDASEPILTKERFWSRRKLVPCIASVATALLLAGLVILLSASKNELIDSVPFREKSRLSFLGPLQPPISRAWEKLRSTWAKAPLSVKIDHHVVSNPWELFQMLGTPVLTNQAGVTAWILNSERTKAVLDRTDLVKDHGADILSDGDLGFSIHQSHEVRFRPRPGSGHSTELAVAAGSDMGLTLKEFALTNSPNAPTKHPSMRPFGVRVTIPKGSSLLLLGPRTEFDPWARFCTLFVPD